MSKSKSSITELKPTNPSSPEAILNGCACPRMDNHNGKGRGGWGDEWGWYISANCPLHGSEGV